jgi:hypothetical protein
MSLPPMVAAAFEAQMAELTAGARAALVPQPPLGWGSDLSCVTDCDADFSELPGNSALGVAQRVARRYLTPRGGLLDDGNYGLDLRGYCNRGVTQQDLRTLQSRCVAEALKEETVASVTVNVSTTSANSLSVSAQLTPADPSIAPFAFVLAVASETSLLELI